MLGRTEVAVVLYAAGGLVGRGEKKRSVMVLKLLKSFDYRHNASKSDWAKYSVTSSMYELILTLSTGLSIEHSVDTQVEASWSQLYTHLLLSPHSSSVTDSAIGPAPSLSPQVALATQHVALSSAPAVSHAAPAQLDVALAGLYT